MESRAPFQAEQYLIDLCDRTSGAPEGSIRETAYLWARGLLDTRFDCLLIPVLVTPENVPLLPALQRQNRERGWGLPEDYFAARLAYGGCLLLIDGAPEAAEAYPRCRSLTVDP